MPNLTLVVHLSRFALAASTPAFPPSKTEHPHLARRTA
ncbi:hypothetical protein DES52_11329 [Deinococcus yavapaiensis KR-236]|uniref:Uncharacterized protein n=1 Tax=Deinococcus yavapaiensis KR-236 TaxID=694435 RepID=A0A318SJ74_9DEIO|nr:hypothetical protein DES52_11329 [Deinococcus yavapaiensis KR-236]